MVVVVVVMVAVVVVVVRRGLDSESKESKELSQASLPTLVRLNFFSAQEFSYYSEFQAAAKPVLLRPCTLHTYNVYGWYFYMRVYTYSSISMNLETCVGVRLLVRLRRRLMDIPQARKIALDDDSSERDTLALKR